MNNAGRLFVSLILLVIFTVKLSFGATGGSKNFMLIVDEQQTEQSSADGNDSQKINSADANSEVAELTHPIYTLYLPGTIKCPFNSPYNYFPVKQFLSVPTPPPWFKN